MTPLQRWQRVQELHRERKEWNYKRTEATRNAKRCTIEMNNLIEEN